MQMPVSISFVAYMLLMVGIGVYFYFKTHDLSDFVLGGRSLGPGVTALSAGASDMSGWLLLGLPGLMYREGMAGSWIAIGLIIGALPLRVFTHHLNDAITIPDYFSNRFEDKGNVLSVVTAVVILLFYTLYTSSGLVGGAKLFEATFGLDYSTALIVGSVVIVSYTFLGGYNAVSWTDFVQGILMMLALVITPLVVISHIGGLGAGLQLIETIDPAKLDMWNGATFIGIVLLMAWGLGYFGQPHILVRFMSIRHENEMHRAKLIGMSWMILSVIGSLSAGFFGLAYVVSAGVDLKDSEKIFITLSQLLFNPRIAGFGAAFGPLVILSLYRRNITRTGAIADMVVGALTVIIWKQLQGGIFDVYELLPGFVAAWLAILIFSKVGTGNSAGNNRIFDEVRAKLKNG